jgi:hypothetical protein
MAKIRLDSQISASRIPRVEDEVLDPQDDVPVKLPSLSKLSFLLHSQSAPAMRMKNQRSSPHVVSSFSLSPFFTTAYSFTKVSETT